MLVIDPHQADVGSAVRLAVAAAQQQRRLLGARELCENPAVSVIDD